MEYNFKVTRYSAIAQIVLGLLLVISGIVDMSLAGHHHALFSITPIVMGLLVFMNGCNFVRGSSPDSAGSSSTASLFGTYLCCSVCSVVFAGIIIILYSFMMLLYASAVMGSIIIISFAVLEFGFGICASVCSCSTGDAICNPSTQQELPQVGQVIYIQTPEGPKAHIMTQGADGVPVAVPVEVSSHAQDISPPPYTARAAVGDDGQAPALESTHRDLPPSYQSDEVGYANSDVVAVPVEVSALAQDISPPPYTARAAGGDDGQAPALESTHRDMPPSYQTDFVFHI